MKNYWLDKKKEVWIRCGDDWVWIKVPKNQIPIDAYTLEEHEKLLARQEKEKRA